jgi:hypothetical protein
MTGSKAAKGVSGWPCNPSNSSCNSPFTCMNLQLTGTVNDLKANYTYSNSNPSWTQGPFNMSGVMDVNSAGYTGVCASTPPNKLIQGQNYPGSYVCSAHTDCKYSVYSNGVWVAGNGITQTSGGGNYMCYNTDGFICAQAASCHPVSHQCEYGNQSTSSYWNPACASCTGCGTSPTVCPTSTTPFVDYITCKLSGQNVAACTGNNTGCCVIPPTTPTPTATPSSTPTPS